MSLSDSDEFVLDSDDLDEEEDSMHFDIEINEAQWRKIAPVEKRYKDDRIYECLGSGWTDVIALQMWKVSKLPCSYKFKKHNIYKRKNYPFFDFYGICTDCHAKFTGTCAKRPCEDNPVIKVSIKTVDTSHIPHRKKRQLAGARRRNAKHILKNVKAKQFKALEAKELMDHSDVIPALLNNSGVYQKARQEAIDEEIELSKYPGNPLRSLHDIMDTTNIIKMISVNPLVVMYWTEQQLKLWKSALELNADTSVDASGSFVKKVKLTDDSNSSAIFLYVIVVRFGGKIFPVCQMLSDSHNTNTISLFLSAVKEDSGIVPKSIIADCSLALLNSISIAYNDSSYNKYLSDCFLLLTGKSNIVPVCLIKRDRNHLIKNVTQWKCFAKKDSVIKDFYTRCIAFCLEVTSFQLLEEVLKKILILCQSTSSDDSTECFKAKEWLIRKIETFNYEDVTDSGRNDMYQSIQILDMEDCEEVPDIILNYLQALNKKSQLMCSFTETDFPKPNMFECPELVENLLALFSQFPAWTNVMNCYYPDSKQVSSSTGSECYFKILRNEYSLSNPFSVNRFILKHLIFIDGDIKIGRALHKNLANLNDKDSNSEENIDNINTKCEKNVSSTTNRKVKEYNDENVIKKSVNVTMNIDYLSNQMKESNICSAATLNKYNNKKLMNKDNVNGQEKRDYCETDLPLIMNGNVNSKIKIGFEIFDIYNTCPFDSIAEIFVHIYTSRKKFRIIVNEFLMTKTNIFLKSIVEYVNKNYSLSFLYTERAKIMLNYANIVDQTVDCEMNVTNLFEKLMKSFSDIVGNMYCNKCGWSKSIRFQTKVIHTFDVISLSNAFLPEIIKCRKCANTAILTYTLGCYIAFDVEHIFEKEAVTKSCDIVETVADNLPRDLKIQEKTYTLVGFVGFTPTGKKKRTGSHYTAYILESDNVWVKRDDLGNVTKVVSNNLKVYVALIIYI